MIISPSVNFEPYSQVKLYRHLGVEPGAGRGWEAHSGYLRRSGMAAVVDVLVNFRSIGASGTSRAWITHHEVMRGTRSTSWLA